MAIQVLGGAVSRIAGVGAVRRISQSRASATAKASVSSAVSGLDIKVESNLSAFTKALDVFGKDQLPFATAGALTATAFIVRNTIVEDTFPRSFNVKTNDLPVQHSASIRRTNANWKRVSLIGWAKTFWLCKKAAGQKDHAATMLPSRQMR